MPSSKLVDNNRRTHAAKVLAETSKKNQIHHEENVSQNSSINLNALNEQYYVIREDVLKLREDLAQGYDLLRDWINNKVSIRALLRAK